MLFLALLLAGAPETVVKSESALENLLGKHELTLQWVSFGDGVGAGEVDVTRDGKLVVLRGEQRDAKTGNYVTIEGSVLRVEDKVFVFDGTIVTRVDHENDGAPCTRKGKMHFRITGKRKYWRLKENRSPCSSLTDYVDIHFSRPKTAP